MLEPVTMEDWDADERPEPAAATPPAWSWPLLLAGPLLLWHERFARDLPMPDPEVLARLHLSRAALLALATVSVPLFALAEAGVYGMLWAARGRRLPVLATAVAVVQCGVTELLALEVLDRARGAEGLALAGATALAGPRVLHAPGAAAGAVLLAFGGAGLFALARLALFAGMQARALPCRAREAFALVVGVWLASHLALAWGIDLLQGRSLRP